MRATVRCLLLGAFAAIASAAFPQPPALTRPAPPLAPIPIQPVDEIVIYRDRNFDGPAVAITQDERNLRLAWSVGSARVSRGTWQLCDRPDFRGSCITLSNSSGNLGRQMVQSVRSVGGPPQGPQAGWRVLGRTDISSMRRDRRVIDIRGNPNMSALRLCVDSATIQLHGARARFSNNMLQPLAVPNRLEPGRCTMPMPLSGPRLGLVAVEVTATSLRPGWAHVRLEGR